MNGEIINKIRLCVDLVRLPNLAFLAYLQFTFFLLYISDYTNQFLDVTTYVLGILFPTVTIMAWGNMINDYADWDSDIINNKRLSGQSRIEKSTLIPVLIVGFIIVDISIILSIFLLQSGLLFVLYLSVIAILILYAFVLKRVAILGNVVIAALALIGVALPYCYILFAQDGMNLLIEWNGFFLFFFGLIFLFTLVREILKDIEDIKGDQSVGYKTLPAVIGAPQSKRLVIIISLVNLLLINIWIIKSEVSTALIILLFAALPLLVFFILYYKNTPVSKMSSFVKTQMFIASFILIAFKYL